MKLQLKPEMFSLLGNKKTSTSRYGRREIKPGKNIVFVMVGNPDITFNAIVTNVSYCKFKDLTIEEAQKEGYDTLEELKEILTEVYHLLDDSIITIIDFVPGKILCYETSQIVNTENGPKKQYAIRTHDFHAAVSFLDSKRNILERIIEQNGEVKYEKYDIFKKEWIADENT